MLFVDPAVIMTSAASFEIGVVAGADRDRRIKHRATLDIGYQPLRALAVAADNDDLARAATRDRRRQTGPADRAGAWRR
jgi:hypothetical protein